MKIELWDLSRIRPYERNPRLNDDAVASVAATSNIWPVGWESKAIAPVE